MGREVPSRGPYRTARVPAERGEVGGVHGRTQTTRLAPQREKKNKRHRHFLDTDLPRATRQPRQPRRHMSAPPTHATQPQRQPLPAPAVGALPAASEGSKGRLSDRNTACESVRECGGFGRVCGTRSPEPGRKATPYLLEERCGAIDSRSGVVNNPKIQEKFCAS